MQSQDFIPDPFTRDLVRDISDQDISQLVFFGSSFHNGDALIHVKNLALINGFMMSLRQSVGRSAKLGNRVDTLLIHKKHKSEIASEPIVLRFYAANVLDCFGPDFQQSLNDLAEYQAARARRKARKIMTSTQTIEIVAGHILNSVTVQGEEARRIIGDLSKINQFAFQFTNRSARSCHICATLNDGTSAEFNFAVQIDLNSPEPFSGLLQDKYAQLRDQFVNIYQ